MEELDNQVRLHLYERFVADGRPPRASETAEALGRDPGDVDASYRRLAEGRVIVLEPGTVDVWMANPLSARRTAFPVETADGRFYFGSCAWDAPGVLAMLRADGRVSTQCPDCREPLELVIREGKLQPIEAVAHFAVPAARWWEDIGFT